MLIAVGSLKGSPGASTLALLLARQWPVEGPRPVVVEADGAGGDVGGRCAVADTPGLASLAAAARNGPVDPRAHATRIGGVPVVVAPAAPAPATLAAALLAGTDPARWAHAPTIVDVGRLAPGTPAVDLAAAAEVVLVCTWGDEASLARLTDLPRPARAIDVVVLGDTPYTTREIRDVTGHAVVARVPWDPAAARAVWGGQPVRPRRLRRGAPAAADALAAGLADLTVPFDDSDGVWIRPPRAPRSTRSPARVAHDDPRDDPDTGTDAGSDRPRHPAVRRSGSGTAR